MSAYHRALAIRIGQQVNNRGPATRWWLLQESGHVTNWINAVAKANGPVRQGKEG